MAIGVLFDNADADNLPISPATRAPTTTFGELRQSAYDSDRLNARFISRSSLQREVQDELYEPVLGLMERSEGGVDRLKLRQDAQQYYTLKKSPALGDRYARDDREAYYAALYEEATNKRGIGIPSMEQVSQTAAGRASASALELAEDQLYSTVPSSRQFLAGLVGGVQAAFTDPVQVAAILGSAPVMLTSRVLASAGAEAAINAAIDVPLSIQMRQWYKEQGREFTNEDMAQMLMFSTIFGAAFGGGTSAIYRKLGGANTQLIPTPGDDVFMLRTHGTVRDRNLRASQMLDDSRTGEVPNVPSGHLMQPSDYMFPGADADNPFKQSAPPGLDARVYQLATSEEIRNVPAMKEESLGSAQVLTHGLSQPYSYLPSDRGYGIDLHTMSWRGAEVDAAHKANLYEGVSKLSRGEMPTVPERTAITVEMTLNDTPLRINDLRALQAGEVTLSLKNKAYRSYLFDTIHDTVVPRLQAQVDAVELPTDRKPVKPKVAKPKYTREQIDSLHDNLLDQEIALDHQSRDLSVERIKVQKQAAEYDRAAREGRELPKKEKGTRNLKQLNDASSKLGKRRTKLNARRGDLANQYKQWESYERSVDEATVVNDALQAEKDLQTFAEGKLPRSFNETRARLDEIYQSLKDNPVLVDDAITAGARTTVDQWVTTRKYRGLPMNAKDGSELAPVIRELDAGKIKKEIDSMYTSLSREDPAFEISIQDLDGQMTTTTLGAERKMIDDLDNAIAEANICGFGAPTT